LLRQLINANMNSLLRHFLSLCLLLVSSSLMAHDGGEDFMRSMGKMYVVVAVIVAIFIGIILFLIFLDKRLTKLENQIKENG
jgi:CcmD family protein